MARKRRSFATGLALCLLAVGSLGGCGKGLAGALQPDFSGIWDITYDDSLELELQLGPDEVVHDTLGEQGGRLSLHDASVTTELDIDCSRSELVCPSEVWPRELILDAPPGKLDSEAVQLSQSLAGRGLGRCAAQAGSVISGEVTTIASATAIRADAVALTSGRVRVVLDGRCFDGANPLPPGARVVLSTGYTAAKR